MPSAAVTGQVKATVAGTSSVDDIYFYIPGPQITSISPASGVVGTQVTVNGSGFQATKGSNYITFQGTSGGLYGTVVSWSDAQIVAAVPSGAVSGPIQVVVNRVASNQNFELSLPNPVVSNISPGTAPVGTQVQINGSGFGATQASSTVSFYPYSTNAAVANWSDTQILATVPSNATSGGVKITVGGVSSNTNIYFSVPPPQITSVSPASGPVGAHVTINGSGFQSSVGSSSVYFNGRTASVVSWSDSQIIATVPAFTSTGPVQVTVNGVSSNLDIPFGVPNPVLTGLVPSTGPVGTQVQINGSGFGATQGNGTVTFTFNSYPAAVTSWSDTQIVATVPAAASTGYVKVMAGGISSNQNVIFNVPAPQITSISPASGVVGTQVTINGSGFQSTRGNSSAAFNGYSGTIVSWSDTQIVTTVPASATTGPVQVWVNSTGSNQDISFTMPAPAIVNLTPSIGPVGTQVQVNGSGFGATQGTSTLTFYPNATPTIVSWSDTQIITTLPAAASTGSVRVTVGGVPSNTNINFTVPAPQVASISPSSGVVGTQVTVNGSGFQATRGSSLIRFNGWNASVVSWSDTQIVATVPSGAITGPVQVFVNNGSSNQDVVFSMPNPVVTAASPSIGGSGTQVTISGTGFGATQGSSTIAFYPYTANAVVTSWSDAQIAATVPSGATSGGLKVIVGGVTSNTNVNFTSGSVIVGSVAPSAGPIGTQVTVNGSGFGATQGTSTISFNNTAATSISSWTDTQIVATIPAGATTGAVKVVNGGVSSNTSVNFTIGAVVVSSIAPTSGPGGTQIQINGSGFAATQGSSWVGIGQYSATVVSWSNTQIVAKAPAVAMTGAMKVTVGSVASNADQNFTVLAPNITSISPTNGPVGTQVTISGSGFGATQGGSTASINNANLTIISWSDTQISATVPPTAATGSVKVTLGGVPSNTNLYFTVPLPHISSVSPITGVVGTQVTISGSGFRTQGSGSLTFYPNIGTTIVSWSDTQIVATVPAGAATGPLSLYVYGYSTPDVIFTMPNPVLTSVSPTGGPVGTQVTIAGHGFGSTQSSSILKFNTAQATILSWSDTQIVATVPNAATSGPVLVTEGGVTSNQSIKFTVPAPQITSISPTSGQIGTQVTINGSGFQSAQGSSWVSFYGGVSPTINSWSDTQIVATVGTLTTTGPVKVSVNGVASNQNVVFEVPAPIVTGIAPSSGPIGTQVQINGSGFGAAQGSSTIVFNGTAATVSSWSDNQIVATIPLVSASAPAVTVTVGGVASNANIHFTVPAPRITSISPVSGVVGTQMTINGSGFLSAQGNGTVSLPGGTGASPTIQSWSDTQIVVTVPIGCFSGPVSVTAHGLISNQDVIFTMPNPTIAGVSPNSGPVGTQVTISGTGFGSTQGSSKVTFNGQPPASIASWSDTQIVATVPPMASSGPVVAQVGGVTGNLNVYFTVPAPQITSITPNIAGAGNTVTITGANFQAVQNQLSSVSFNGGTAAIASWSDTQIVATVPAPARTGPVYVNVSGIPSNPVNYTIPNNFVASLSPASGPVGTQVTIAGTGFGATQGTSVLTFNGQLPSAIASWSDTQIVATVPVTAASGPVAVNVNNVPGNLTTIFTVPPPKITAMSPAGGVAGTQVTITGSGFQANQRDSTVAFNGVPATITSWSDTQIVTSVPSTASSGPLLITVNSVNNGTGNVFEVPHLTVSSIDPPCGPAYGLFTIHGSGFTENQGPGQVYINGVQEGVAYLPPGSNVPDWHDSSIVIQLNPSTVSGPLTVTRYDATSNSVPFTFTANPVITSVSPAVAPVGASVTISGSGFCAAQSSSTIQFSGVAANVTSWSDSQIVATVPPGASSGPLVVSVAGIEGSGTSFNVSTTVQLTDSLGNSSSYTSEDVGGAWYTDSSQGSGCSSCTIRGVLNQELDPVGNVLSKTDELQHKNFYTYDDAGNVTSETEYLDVNTPVKTSYTYNSFGEPLTVTDPLGNVTTNGYDANGNLTSITSPAPDGTTAASVTGFVYDPKGELTQITDPLNHITTLAYYPTGLIQSITDAQSNVTSYEYDLRGNRTAVVDALLNRTTFDYDMGNRLIKITYPDQSTVSFTYDSRGRRTSVTDQNQNVTLFGYDDADRLISVTDAANHTTLYAYDTENNLLSITDANNHTTSFSYDAFGRVTQTTFPSTLAESYVYDAIGNLTSKTDRKNQTIQYVYDALNRLQHKGYPDSTGVDYVYDLVGKLKQVTDATGTYGFAYDNMGRLVGTTTSYAFLPGKTFTNSYAYDAASNRTSFTAPDGSTDSYGYNTLNRLTTLTDSLTGQFTFGYDALSRRTSLTRPNGVNTGYTYDSLSHLLSILHQFGTNTIDGATYLYDPAGNRISKTNLLNNVTENYTYDPIYQLIQVTQRATTTESYTYDPVGNRLSSLGMSPYVYNSSNELTSTPAATYAYDNNGNTLTKTDSSGATTYNWDFDNRLTSAAVPGVGTVSFRSDPFGRRIQKSGPSGTINYFYEGANAIEEIDTSGNLLAHYAQGGRVDEPLATLRSGVTAFYQEDGLASISSLSSLTGALSDSYTYDAFGNPSHSGSFLNPYRYTGRDYDSETALQYSRARYYDPLIGRFLSEDSIRFAAGPNMYAYVRNNPQNFSDPSGNIPIAIPVPWWWLGSGSAGGVIVGIGRITGPVGAAGTVGWGIGRGIGHIPLYGGGTVDDGWQQIFTILFFSTASSQSQHQSDKQACKKNKSECDRRHAEEVNFCVQEYGNYPNLLHKCFERAMWRWNNCRRGLPDPGPLDPLDPNWSPN